MSVCYLNLEKLTIDYVEKSGNSASLLSFISQHSNLRILSLSQCNLSSIATSSLIHFLQSPNNRLHKLTLNDCTIQISGHTNSAAISYQRVSILLSDSGKFSLEITGCLYAINYVLSQPNQFYSNTLTILKVVIVSGTAESLLIDTSLYPNLEKLDITPTKKNYTLLHVSVLVSSQQSNFCLLSMKRCNLTCDTVMSLIHSLQSSHCGLQLATLDDCISDHTHTTTTSSKLNLKSLDSGNVSLELTGYCCDISHWLSQLSSYTQLTELILHLERQHSTTADVLQYILLYHHVLESLTIDNNDFTHLSISNPHFIELQQNNLRSLSLRRCNLSSDVTSSFIQSLQSTQCRLHKLKIDKCTISTTDETQQNKISTKSNTTLCSLVTSDSLCVLNHIFSNVLFARLTELSVCITSYNSTAADLEVLTRIPVSCPVLEIIKIDSSISLSLPISILQFIGSQQNNLHTLSLSRCTLSSEFTTSLIDSMQSIHCKLQNLALKKCTIYLPKDTQQTTILTKTNAKLHSLDISWSVLNQMMSCINPFTQSLTELILHVDNDTHTCTSGVETILQEIPTNCPLLETLKIDCVVCIISIPPAIPQFIGSQQNNIHTVSLWKCKLSIDVTRSLIHSLWSPHCKLYKLALYDCTIPTTDHTQLTTAIVSSTTITHLFFIDRNIDTPSLTALASGLKHNTTIEQLAVDKYVWDFTKDQFQVLIDAVDSNVVRKLWLYDCRCYKGWFSVCTLYRSNVNIEWYLYYDDLYNKW